MRYKIAILDGAKLHAKYTKQIDYERLFFY